MKLVIDSVSKLYRGKIWGLRDFSLELDPGVLGLLGPNGAGKSTLMRILATIAKPTEGRVTWNGADIVHSPNELRTMLGYLPQDFGVYPHLNAVEFLEYMAAIKGLDGRSARRRIGELLEMVNLFGVRKRPLGGYSGGMKQRLGIAQALLNDPQLLILDEPTAGLDPEERVRFRGLLSELGGERIVILSTHIVSDVEAAATHMALIKQGRLLRHAAPETLLQAVEGKVWEWVVPSAELPTLKQWHVISSETRRSDPRLEDAYLYFITADEPGGE
jgi:ABC-2 type transport system ATP-binding protein